MSIDRCRNCPLKRDAAHTGVTCIAKAPIPHPPYCAAMDEDPAEGRGHAPRIVAKSLAQHETNPNPMPYPSAWEMFQNAAAAAMDFARSGFALASPEEAERRLAICRTCEHFDPGSVRCRKCACWMNFKTMGEAMKCPIGKW